MSRMFLVWSLLMGLALVGADWYVERGSQQQGRPSYEGGTPMNAITDVSIMENGNPIPPPK